MNGKRVLGGLQSSALKAFLIEFISIRYTAQQNRYLKGDSSCLLCSFVRGEESG